jgi:hypothetical protein
MALKQVDFRQLLLEKGEKIGLGVAGVLAGLLVVWYGVSAATSDGPQKKAKELQGLKEQAKSKWESSAPPESVGELPADLQVVEVKPVEAAWFPTPQTFFLGGDAEDRRWRMPKVLAPDEFAVQLVRGAVQAYMLDEQDGRLLVAILQKGAAADPNSEGSRKQREAALKQFSKAGARAKLKAATQPAAPPGAPGAAPGTPGGPPLVPPGGGTGKGGGGLPGAPAFGREGGTVYDNQELKFVPADKIGEGDQRLAQTNIPRRMIVVTAAFPYKEQLEEYRKAMRYASVEDLLLDPQAHPEFIGLYVQRRVRGVDGNLVSEAWADLDVDGDLQYLLVRAVGREPEDPTLKEMGIIVEPNRIVQWRPLLARDQKYPDVRLEGIAQTMEAVAKAWQAGAPPPPEQKSGFKDVPVYETPDADAPPGAPGRVGKGVGKGAPAGVQPPPGAAPSASQPLAIPDKCLVRFLDTDRNLRPGYSYEYRVRMRIANPCYQKPERAAYPKLAEEKEVVGEWQEVRAPGEAEPTRVRIPDELLYYVVEEKGDRPQPTAARDEVFVQVHRWLTEARTKPGTPNTEVQVGDWTVLERRGVRRGEYVGSWAEVPVPAWIPSRDRFIIAVHPDELKQARGRLSLRQHKGIPIDFATDPVYGDRSLLVDFEGGEHKVTVNGRPASENGPVEMLVLDANGRLVVHNSRADTESKERQDRVDAWKKWVDYVRNQADDKTEKKEQDLFQKNPPGKGGSAGTGSGR